MKKIISISLLIVIISGIFFPKVSLTYEGTKKSTLEEMQIDHDTYMKDSEKGSSKIGNNSKEEPYKIGNGTQNSVIKNLVGVLNVIPTTVRFFLYILSENGSSKQINEQYGSGFSIQKLVFNKIDFFKIDFFTSEASDSNLGSILKNNIAGFFYGIRNIGIVANLAVLIYAGIRIAIASIAIEKAKYKKMLMGWVRDRKSVV